MNIPSIITDATITVVINNKPFVVGKTHPNFYEIKSRLLAKEHDDLESLFDVAEGYKSYSNGLIEIDGSNLLYNGLIIHNVLAARIVDMIQNGDVVEPMIAFLKNVMLNPSEGSADQLYTFLEHKNLPFTEDGCFLAYKAINNNYTDKWTGGVSNKIGETVTMERDDVTADPEQGCSSGLHCGSIEYVRGYGHFPCHDQPTEDDEGQKIGDRLIVVKVNPADVVSVPTDCSCQKLRTFKYVVHEEVEDPYTILPKYEAPVYYDDDEDEDYEDEDWDEYEDYEEDEEDYEEDEEDLEETQSKFDELKDLIGHPSGDFGGARINVLHSDEELAGIGDMDFLGEQDQNPGVVRVANITHEGDIEIHVKPPTAVSPPKPKEELPPPPPVIVISEDPEVTTVEPSSGNTDGLILPNNVSKR